MRAFDALPRLAELSLQTARQAGSLALSVVRSVAAPVLACRSEDDGDRRTGDSEPPTGRSAGEPSSAPGMARGRAARAPTPTPTPDPPRREPEPPEPAPPEPEPPEPAHVDRDAVVVAQSADAGAADGAGAQIRVDEPWSGYRQLTAKDVTAQLATADAAMLAVVRLYESTHRNRSTVLAEIDRRLATVDR